MLIGMPKNLSPDILHLLNLMGHGDKVAIVDRNFPASSHTNRLCYSYGAGIAPVLQSVLEVIPLDYAVEKPVQLMCVPAHIDYIPTVWEEYSRILQQAGYTADRIEYLERPCFYECAAQCQFIIQTGETQRFSNIILQKGIITD